MYCKQCGREVEGSAKFCVGCGARIIKPSEVQPQPYPEIREDAEYTKKFDYTSDEPVKYDPWGSAGKKNEPGQKPRKQYDSSSVQYKNKGCACAIIGIVAVLLIVAVIGGAVGFAYAFGSDYYYHDGYKNDGYQTISYTHNSKVTKDNYYSLNYGMYFYEVYSILGSSSFYENKYDRYGMYSTAKSGYVDIYVYCEYYNTSLKVSKGKAICVVFANGEIIKYEFLNDFNYQYDYAY